MDAVLRATAMYLLLLTVFRVSGRRMLAELTTFDFVLLLIIGDATGTARRGLFIHQCDAGDRDVGDA